MNLINEIKQIYTELNKDTTKSEISELHIHKLLYFIYGYFYQKYNKELFKADFVAFKYGPIEINYRIDKEIKEINIYLSKEKIIFIKDNIKKLLVYAPWFLVEQSHLTTPWINNYSKNKTNKINNSEIKDFFKKLN